MTALYLLDPEVPDPSWAPFAGATPLCELRAGAWRLRERWARGLGAKVAGILSESLGTRQLIHGPPLVQRDQVVGPAWVADATFAPKLPMRSVGGTKRLLHAGRTVAWRLENGQRWEAPFNQGDGLVIEGRALRGAWDLVTALEQFLFADTLAEVGDTPGVIPDGIIVLGNPGAVVLRDADLEPGVVLDARKGAIVLESRVQVKSGTRLEGPFYAGRGTLIVGGQLRHVSAGPECRLHGEISTSTFMGYANKSHDGFVGHSVIGEWVNLGAGTITSNLKNTYGPVRLDMAGSRIETQRNNLGALIGDHAKTAIGTLLSTGTVIGAGANLFGPPRAPRYVPPFAWGGIDDQRLDLEAFIVAAHRILPRRAIEVTPAIEAGLRELHRRLVTK